MPKGPVINSKPYGKQSGVVIHGGCGSCGKMKFHGGKDGRGLKKLENFAIGANKYLKKSNLISKVAKVADQLGVPNAGRVARIAKQGGYGKRRKK